MQSSGPGTSKELVDQGLLEAARARITALEHRRGVVAPQLLTLRSDQRVPHIIEAFRELSTSLLHLQRLLSQETIEQASVTQAHDLLDAWEHRIAELARELDIDDGHRPPPPLGPEEAEARKPLPPHILLSGSDELLQVSARPPPRAA